MTAVMRTLVLLLIALFGVATAMALSDAGPTPEAPAVLAMEPRGFTPLPSAASDAGPALLARSPFARDRSAYARSQNEPMIVERVLEVRLVAVFSAAGAPRATLLIDGAEVTVGVGDTTPAGVVDTIESEAIVFDGADGRRVSLFE